MILRARWVVDRNLRVHENGSVNTGVGGCSINFGRSILMPGLVNAHCHLDYTNMRGLIPPQKSFTAWINRITQRKRTWTNDDFTRSITQGLEDSLHAGTTTMVNWICSPPWIETVVPLPMRVWWLWEQIMFQPTPVLKQWDKWPSQISGKSALWHAGIAPHAPYTCGMEVIQKAVRWSAQRHLPWSIHVAESKDEFDMYRHASGPMFKRFQDLGRNMHDCGYGTPLVVLKCEILNSKSPVLLVHANYLESSDFSILKSAMDQSQTQISIVHCPRSHKFFGHRRFPLKRLVSMGLNVCLGTDSLASNNDLSMFHEMSHLAKTHPEIDLRQIVCMATICGARALGVEGDWFHWQDWIAIPTNASSEEKVWQVITRFTGKPDFVMVDGQPCNG